jgi:hypothetical protein
LVAAGGAAATALVAGALGPAGLAGGAALGAAAVASGGLVARVVEISVLVAVAGRAAVTSVGVAGVARALGEAMTAVAGLVSAALGAAALATDGGTAARLGAGALAGGLGWTAARLISSKTHPSTTRKLKRRFGLRPSVFGVV